MSRYFIFSSACHLFLFLAFFFILRNGAAGKKVVYYIDFIGAPTVINASKLGGKSKTAKAKALKKPKKPSAKKQEIDIGENFILPKPSMLGETKNLFSKQTGEEEPKTPNEENVEYAGVSANFSNFPYPWYISKVRQNLSEQWTVKMPKLGNLRAVIKFEILRNGEIKRLKVVESSKNSLFDNAALISVQNAAPFDELPTDFPDSALIVYVEFRPAN